jgi:hypothetical protein
MAFDSVTRFIKSGLGGLPSTNKESVPVTQVEDEASMFKQYGQKQVLLEFVQLGAYIFLVVAILLALMQDFALILMIGGVVVFYYILTKKYAGSDILCQLNTYGLVYGGRTYYWGTLRRFFFSKRGSEELLMVDLLNELVSRLLITFPADKRGEIEKILKEHVMFLEIEPKSGFDKSVDSLMNKLNFEEKK